MKKLLIAAGCVLALTTACDSNTTTKTEGGDHDHPEHREEVRDTKPAEGEAAEALKLGTANFSVLMGAYISLKESLVESNAEAAAAAGQAFGIFAKTQGDAFAGMAETAESIAASEDIEEQRAAFHTLSKEMYTVAKANESKAVVYQQYCPMAFDNAGATWLSMEEEIKNPYFGDAMLTCGNVAETIVAE